MSYEVSKSIENCEPSLVVSTKEDCEGASEQLDLSFKLQINRNDRHAGCYKDGELTYFNKIIIPSDTPPGVIDEQQKLGDPSGDVSWPPALSV